MRDHCIRGTPRSLAGGVQAAEMTLADSLGLQSVQLLAKGPGGKEVKVPASEALKGKTLGLYFSAHWCPPCRGFTPVLAEVYSAVRKTHEDFEVLFVSCDKSQAQFEEYFRSMPWLAVPFDQPALRQGLGDRFGLGGIPRLVMLGPDGQVLAGDARSAVMADRAGANFPWAGAAGGPGGLLGLLSSPRGLLLVIMFIYWLWQQFTKKQ